MEILVKLMRTDLKQLLVIIKHSRFCLHQFSCFWIFILSFIYFSIWWILILKVVWLYGWLVGCRTRKLYFYPKTGFYFRTCEDGAGWHLIPCRISPRSEFFPRAHKNWHIMWGVNLGLDWPPLVRGSKFHTIHTPTKATSLPPLDNGRYGPLGLVVIILIRVVGNSGFPYKNLKELIGQF